MNLNGLLPRVGANAETYLLGSALHFVTSGEIDVKHLNQDAVAIALFSLADQLEAAHPGISERHGWANIADFQAFSTALGAARAATPPDGLK